jgi:trehalose synthase
VITGGNDFFEVTKSFHNALHGAEFTLTPAARDVFLRHTELNRQRMTFDEDFVVIHDPQPLGLISSKTGSASWVWRCHIDLSHPNPDVWNFLQPMVERYDATVFSSPAFARRLAIPQALSISVLIPSPKKTMSHDRESVATLRSNRIAPDRFALRRYGQ